MEIFLLIIVILACLGFAFAQGLVALLGLALFGTLTWFSVTNFDNALSKAFLLIMGLSVLSLLFNKYFPAPGSKPRQHR